MDDASRVRAEHRAAQVVVTTPAVPGTHRHSIEAEVATIDLAASEQQASSAHPSVQREGRTATATSSHAYLERVNAQVVLLMTCELLRYRPMDAGYNAWLAHFTELVTVVGEAEEPSRSLRPLHPAAKERLRGRYRLLSRATTKPSTGAACASGTRLKNTNRTPKKKETTARSSYTRLLLMRARSLSSSVTGSTGSLRMLQQLGARIGLPTRTVATQALYFLSIMEIVPRV
ncbi:hypothetical protein D1007_42602 [Hordeum vulgare]|nr:hypothetical protein D1007_42602 [Hordeum vulgare]